MFLEGGATRLWDGGDWLRATGGDSTSNYEKLGIET